MHRAFDVSKCGVITGIHSNKCEQWYTSESVHAIPCFIWYDCVTRLKLAMEPWLLCRSHQCPVFLVPLDLHCRHPCCPCWHCCLQRLPSHLRLIPLYFQKASILAEAFDQVNAYRKWRDWRAMSGDGENESCRTVVLVEVRHTKKFASLVKRKIKRYQIM